MDRIADPTLQEIRWRLEEAADTLRRLPRPREYGALKGGRSSMPDYVRDAMEAYGWSEAKAPRVPPPAAAIDRLDEVLLWMRWLPASEARLVWMRAVRINWKRVSEEFECDRTTAWRRWTAALMAIAMYRERGDTHTAAQNSRTQQNREIAL